MNAKPRRHMGDHDTLDENFNRTYTGDLRLIYAQDAGTLVFECEIMQPPSSKGRTVYVWFEGQDLTDAMKAMKDEAIRARSQPLGAK